MEKNENAQNDVRTLAEKLDEMQFDDVFVPGENEKGQEQKKNAEPQDEPQEEPATKENPQEEFEVPDDSFSKDDDDDADYFNRVYNNWREVGLLGDAPELEAGKVLTNDELIRIIEENKRKLAQDMFENEFLSKFSDPEAQEYLRYVMNGGDSKSFFRQRMESPATSIDGDISDERVQNKVIATYLSQFNGMEQDEIAEQIQMMTDAGKKEKYAKMYLDKINQYDAAQKESMKRENEIRERQEKENYNKMVQTFSTELKGTENIFGTKCDDKRRVRLMDMMFKPIQMQDGSMQTEFNIRLFNAIQNPKTAIILADLLANDFDTTKYSKSFETQATKKVRAGLDSRPKIKKNQTSPFDNLF